MIKGQSSSIIKRRRTRAAWEEEVENIEIPILRPRSPPETQELGANGPMEATDPQEPAEGQTQVEILLNENELLKEDVQELRVELQISKEASKNKVTRGLEMLA